MASNTAKRLVGCDMSKTKDVECPICLAGVGEDCHKGSGSIDDGYEHTFPMTRGHVERTLKANGRPFTTS